MSWRVALTARARSWLVFVCVAAIVGIFLTVWTVYSVTHTQSRFVQLEPGAVASANDMNYRVLSMKQTQTLTSETDATEASAGSVYVIVEVEVTTATIDDETFCHSMLVGPNGRTWEVDALSIGSRKTPMFCSPENGLKANTPFTWEQVFLVPEDDADSIFGLGIEPNTGEPVMVISPAN